ncbi:TfdA family Taurine catabolism dioxygenase TauD [Apiospora hydei]|uniref:TfdA family Taurine catabolism dioxygenase TauD n=1 Tax=Apiospora hydei TaxID=1337664 RepID=A0ABR1WBL5_9PEZI
MAPSVTSTVTVTEPVSVPKNLKTPSTSAPTRNCSRPIPSLPADLGLLDQIPAPRALRALRARQRRRHHLPRPPQPHHHHQHTHHPLAGTEVRGVQLSSLSPAGKDQLARLVAERKVVAFRDQDFKDLPIQSALDYGGYFGRHHIHPASGAPAGYPEVHLVHRGEGDESSKQFYASRTSSVAWHSDVSYEEQPPGTTFLYIFDKPETGGDTLFANTVEAYNRLSPLFQERLHGLQATHSGFEQAAASLARGGIVRREPVANVHPIVRTHPATGEKSLYVNPQFTREIVGMKKEESDAILNFLYSHIAWGADFHVRVKWEQGTVVVWDNRVTQHSALVDWENKQRRHLARITPQAERPYETPFQG